MRVTFKKDINNADNFVKLCSAYKEDIDLFAGGKYIVNAKSLLGVASCAGYDDLEVDIKTNDSELADRFYDAVKRAGFANERFRI
jgi:phosphotransferase system HPr-like phosphotransfer protein